MSATVVLGFRSDPDPHSSLSFSLLEITLSKEEEFIIMPYLHTLRSLPYFIITLFMPIIINIIIIHILIKLLLYYHELYKTLL